MTIEARSRHDLILDAAEKLWTAGGDEGFTMEALAEKAGVSRVTLYRHFANRAEVIAVLARDRGIADAGEDRPDVRMRVIEAARRVFGSEGPGRATIEHIAKVAGIGEATVYRHFGDKAGLLAAVANESPARRAARELPLSVGEEFESDLVRFATKTIAFIESNPGMIAMVITEYREQPELFARVREQQNRTHKILTRHFAEAMRVGRLRTARPEDAAGAFVALMFGVALVASLVLLPNDGAEAHARFVVSTFLDGFGARPKKHRGKRRG